MGGRRRRRKSGAVKHFNRLFSLTCREEGANSYSRIHTVFPPNILRLHPASRPSIRLPSHFRHNTTFLEYKYNVLWQISVKLMKAMRKWIYSRKVISANCHSYIGGETKPLKFPIVEYPRFSRFSSFLFPWLRDCSVLVHSFPPFLA